MAETTSPQAKISLLAFVGRWIAVLPASLLGACLAYLLSSIVNSIGGDIASGIVALIAAGLAGFAAVAAAQYVAPTAKLGVGLAIAAAVLLFSFYGIVSGFTSNYYDTTFPLWFMALLYVALAIGSIIGVFAERQAGVMPAFRISNLARWILFVPGAVVLAFAVILAIDIPVAIHFDGTLPPLVNIEARFLSGITAIAVATAIAPAGRRIVVSLVGGLWGLSGTLYFLSALFRPVLIPYIEHVTNERWGSALPIWLQALTGFAWMAAAAIPIAIVFTLPKKTTNA